MISYIAATTSTSVTPEGQVNFNVYENLWADTSPSDDRRDSIVGDYDEI